VVRKDQQPITATTGTQEALAQAQAILARGMTLATQDDSWKVSDEDLALWIVFEPQKTSAGDYELTVSFDQDAIESYLAELAPGLNTPARDAQFAIVNGRVEAFQLERPGYQLRLVQSAEVVRQALLADAKRATLLFDTTPPSISIGDIENLNINALLGRGESDFAGSPANRIHNIKVGSNKYQGMIIASGEEFSFNQILGEVDAANGYLPELVIKNNQTVPEYGGGICQVSTTLFRAAIYAGMDITARQNHSYVVRYYGTPGFDATIYPPFPDMRFRNNTPGHILIQYRIVGTKLIFEIYGQDDGRNVEVIGPTLYDQQENGAVKAWLKQTVTNSSGAVFEEQTFYSNYRSAQNYPVNRNPLE
jgi:vancomycin resistance protein YoaR